MGMYNEIDIIFSESNANSVIKELQTFVGPQQENSYVVDDCLQKYGFHDTFITIPFDSESLEDKKLQIDLSISIGKRWGRITLHAGIKSVNDILVSDEFEQALLNAFPDAPFIFHIFEYDRSYYVYKPKFGYQGTVSGDDYYDFSGPIDKAGDRLMKKYGKKFNRHNISTST